MDNRRQCEFCEKESTTERIGICLCDECAAWADEFSRRQWLYVREKIKAEIVSAKEAYKKEMYEKYGIVVFNPGDQT